MRAIEEFGLDGPVEDWRAIRDEVHHIRDRGLGGDEHPFLACSCWLVRAYARAGRREEAEALSDRLVGLTNDVGLLSEEYDAGQNRMAGNFPQAFSHLALIQASLDLASARG